MSRRTKAAAQAPAQPKPKRELRIVDGNVALLWPDGFESRYRGQHPYVVDMSAPLERDLFCKGQEHKLRELNAEERRLYKDPSPILGNDTENGRSCWAALALIRDEGERAKSRPAPKSVAESLVASDEEAASVVDADEIPEPDEPDASQWVDDDEESVDQ